MITYIDASVILRLVFHEPSALAEWAEIETGVTSRLTQLECARTLDRFRLRGKRIASITVAAESARAILNRMRVVELTDEILDAAAQPMTVPIASLDSIHLLSADAFRRSTGGGRDVVFATHDRELAEAAKSLGFPVIGAA